MNILELFTGKSTQPKPAVATPHQEYAILPDVNPDPMNIRGKATVQIEPRCVTIRDEYDAGTSPRVRRFQANGVYQFGSANNVAKEERQYNRDQFELMFKTVEAVGFALPPAFQRLQAHDPGLVQKLKAK